jgi:hypothetical protein
VLQEADPSEPVRSPRLSVLRAFPEVKATLAMLGAGYPVLVVLRAPESERRRLLDVLTGWAVGAGGTLDRIGPNTLIAAPPGGEPVRLGHEGMVSAVEEAFTTEKHAALGREEEERLVPLAVAGSQSARRRIIDTYAELATVFALRIRPSNVSQARAVDVAQAELERLVTYPSRGPLLASLFEGITKALLH